MPDLEDAIALAALAHRGQRDKGGAPYILHPLRLMLRMETDVERVVALLHDVVEDTPYTLDALQRLGYPAEVVAAVDALTRRRDEGESYEDFIRRVRENPLAARVKIADLEDNLELARIPDPRPADLERLARYRRALEVLRGRAGEDPVIRGGTAPPLDIGHLTSVIGAKRPVVIPPEFGSVRELVGVDGCSGGWLAATGDLALRSIRFDLLPSLQALFARARAGEVLVVIDMPIGLPEASPRECDLQARKLLGPGRTSSVFPPPCRDALKAATYREACERNARVTGKSLSQQAFAITGRIAEIDGLISPELQSHVHEAHPEVTFAVLAGHGLRDSKRSATGRAERLRLLAAEGVIVDPAAVRRSLGPSKVAPDDVLDAAACVVTARRILQGRAARLPAGTPPSDARGLAMCITA
jgi:predicted RNase H-like nuclease